MLRRPRTWCGFLLCVIGGVLVRWAAPTVTPVDLANAVYLVGIAAALAGLAVCASMIEVVSVNVIACPQCFHINVADATVCLRCKTPISAREQGLVPETGRD